MEELVKEWESLHRQSSRLLESQDRLVRKMIDRSRTQDVGPHPSQAGALRGRPSPTQSEAVAAQGLGRAILPPEAVQREAVPLFKTAGIEESLRSAASPKVASTATPVSQGSRKIKKVPARASLNMFADSLKPEEIHLTTHDPKGTTFKDQLLKQILTFMDWWCALEEPDRTGWAATICQHSLFDICTLCVVLINCCFTILEQNAVLANLGSEPPKIYAKAEIAFACYFTLEICLRIYVHRLYFFANHDMGWNITDFLLVFISVIQLFQEKVVGDKEGAGMQLNFLRSLRVLKLARILRLLRMVKIFTDLRVMVQAFLSSCLALFWCMVLLVFTIGMFALLFVQVVGDFLQDNLDVQCVEGERCLAQELLRNFGSVETSMLTLYMATTGGNDWSQYYELLTHTGSLSTNFFLFYTAFYYFGVFNLLTGMFVDKAVRASQPDADLVILEQRTKEEQYIRGFKSFFSEWDMNNDGHMDKGELMEVLATDNCRLYLSLLGLEPQDTEILFDSLREVQDPVPVEDFVKGCMRLRGFANSIDLCRVQFELTTMGRHQSEVMQEIKDVHRAVREVTLQVEEVAARKTVSNSSTPTPYVGLAAGAGRHHRLPLSQME